MFPTFEDAVAEGAPDSLAVVGIFLEVMGAISQLGTGAVFIIKYCELFPYLLFNNVCVLILLIVFMANISPLSRPGKPCPNLDQSESKDLGWCQFHPYDLLVTQNDIPGDIWS